MSAGTVIGYVGASGERPDAPRTCTSVPPRWWGACEPVPVGRRRLPQCRLTSPFVTVTFQDGCWGRGGSPPRAALGDRHAMPRASCSCRRSPAPPRVARRPRPGPRRRRHCGGGRGRQPGLVGADTSLGSGDASAAGEALDRIEANVEQQLTQLESAEAAVAASVKQLGARAAAVVETQRRIDELTQRMDHVTIGAYIDPPSLAASRSDRGFGGRDVGAPGGAGHPERRDRRRPHRARRAPRRAPGAAGGPGGGGRGGEAAQADAEAALEDVKSAVSQQTQFVNALKKGLEVDAAALEALRATDPARAISSSGSRPSWDPGSKPPRPRPPTRPPSRRSPPRSGARPYWGSGSARSRDP